MPKGPTGKIQRRQLSKILGLDAAEPRHKSSEHREQISAFESELLELWRKMLDCNSIGLDDDFFDMGGDSLRAVQMLVEVEKMAGHRVPEMILFERSTVRQLARGVAELDLKGTPIIQIQAKGDRPPFFFFHGDYTGGYYTRRLARLVGPGQPFISVAPHGLGPESIPPSIEQMAVERLPLLLAAQSQGPFRLGGYCRGAMVALEVARLLIGAGHRVELLVLIDWPTLNLRPTARILHRSIVKILRIAGDDWEHMYPRLAFAMDMLWRLLGDLNQISFALLTRYLANFRRNVWRELFGRAADLDVKSQAAKLPEELTRRERQLDRIYNRLYRHYFPKKIEVPVIYFSAEYGGRLLHNLSPKVELITVPGGHWGCITTHVEVLAGHLRRRLEESSPLGLSEVPKQSGNAGGAESQPMRAHSASLIEFSPPIQASIKQES
jgi:thioesterase domain-containing protein/acyl carrier protein